MKEVWPLRLLVLVKGGVVDLCVSLSKRGESSSFLSLEKGCAPPDGGVASLYVSLCETGV